MIIKKIKLILKIAVFLQLKALSIIYFYCTTKPPFRRLAFIDTKLYWQREVEPDYYSHTSCILANISKTRKGLKIKICLFWNNHI